MIYWFSGTGNSRFVASELGKALGQELQFIPSTSASRQTPDSKGMGFVFPVYSWGVPPVVLDFIAGLPDSFAAEQLYTWAAMTCGDEVAKTPEMLARALRRKGIKLNACWSVIMPNNYVLLPGFDVDSAELAEQKLRAVPARIEVIASEIRQKTERFDVTRGSSPRLKSMVWHLFKRWGVFPSKWKVNDKCVDCGRCSTVCPVGNIKMEAGHPVWGKDCISCVACYHACKLQAIEYGKFTRGKGRYFFPDFVSSIRKGASRNEKLHNI